MMLQTSSFKMAFVEDPSMEMVELPYYGRDLSMILLLPVAVDALAELENALSSETLAMWLAELDRATPHRAWVRMPRFATTQTLNLATELKSLGMISAFGKMSNFSGMDGTTNLFLSTVLHRALVEVNESGTEAAAVTLVHIASRSGGSGG